MPSSPPVHPVLRLYTELPLAGLASGTELALPPGPARHVQVRRLQPGDALALFDGSGRDWEATVCAMGKAEVRVRLGTAREVHAELPWPVTLALAMPANDRMDTVVEKATELGAACVQPLVAERSVLRLAGERAQRKQAHWQAVAQAACEQCGRAAVPRVAPVLPLLAWLQALPPAPARAADGPSPRLLLSLQAQALPLARQTNLLSAAPGQPLISLSGPEGGLTPAEEAAACRAGFRPTALGPRTLRADTAPLALLAWLALAGSCAPAPPQTAEG